MTYDKSASFADGSSTQASEKGIQGNLHLSYPNQNSVTDFIDDALCSVNCAKFDETISMVKRFGRGSYFANSDIRSTFRLLAIYTDMQGIRGSNKMG